MRGRGSKGAAREEDAAARIVGVAGQRWREQKRHCWILAPQGRRRQRGPARCYGWQRVLRLATAFGRTTRKKGAVGSSEGCHRGDELLATAGGIIDEAVQRLAMAAG
ncbi:hypothetical protein B296_00002947 [Ensete ventricosum]|uniref:Uncharacterized protein n=1 Tax=Ensete ventricosum TaxID=4639 RepID=A0A426YG49_ENSVE|nr:hypothetical protein B296_00002947 [Ensete ventricosum]